VSRRRRLAAIAGVAVVILAVAAIGAGAWLTAARPASAGPAPRFVDETASSGLDFTYDGPFDDAVGGGVAVLDCNGDGKPDLYLAGGANSAGLFRNDSPVGGSLAFSRITSPVTDLTDVNGAYPIDIDGDGITDLVVLRNSGNLILRGLGGCRFQDVTAAWGLNPGTDHTEAFSATWEPGNRWPTIAFGNYVNFVITDVHARCEPNDFIRPSASGTGFAPAIPLTPAFCALSLLFSDWDGSGRSDLRVSNDDEYYDPYVGSEQLWRVDPGRTPRLYTAADGWVTVHVEGMGIASYDLTGDGLPEVYLTSQAASRLQTLADGPSRPVYKDIGLDYGVNVAHPFMGANTNLPSTAWHDEFEDVNNDGRIDLFVSKGNVTSQPDYAQQDPSNLLLGQPDGTFAEAADKAGIVTYERGRGAALADFNLDGRLDLVQSFYGAPVRIWRNAGPVTGDGSDAGQANWLALRLSEPGGNVDAIGSVIEIQAGSTTWRREITIGGGHAGGQLGWIHFGLGAATSAQVRVHWPDGQVGPWQAVAANGFEIVDRASGTIQPWIPGP